jgi:hypothetical protein
MGFTQYSYSFIWGQFFNDNELENVCEDMFRKTVLV